MPAKIFLLDTDDHVTPLEESGYPSEDHLQHLLAENPDLLAGDQVAPDDPLRWLLVAREAAIADGEDGAPRWAVDHLFVDHRAVPTLVEVKRTANPQLRREVVGQLLEYAANAAFTWKPGDLRRLAEGKYEREDEGADGVLAERLGIEEPEDFWAEVDDNLRLGRMRLLFVADQIPTELQRVVEFLNERMDPTEVLAVEVRQFAGALHRTIVPRVLGGTSAAQARKGRAGRSKPWTREEFLEELAREVGREAREPAKSLMDWWEELGLRSSWGRGKVSGSFLPTLDHGGERYRLFCLWTGGQVEVPFHHLVERPPFDDLPRREELARRLGRIEGCELDFEALDRYQSFSITLLHTAEALEKFKEAIRWGIGQIEEEGD